MRRQLNVPKHFPGCNGTDPHAEHHLRTDPHMVKLCVEPPEFGHTTLEVFIFHYLAHLSQRISKVEHCLFSFNFLSL